MMNIKYLALTIAIALPTSAFSQTPSVVETRSATVVSTSKSTSAKSDQGIIYLASGTYVIDFIVNGTTTGAGTIGAYSLLREGLKSTNQMIDLVANFFKPKAGGSASINDSLTFTVENGDEKFFLWESSVYVQFGQASYSTTISAIPVPGPEAGAGLGAAAIGGIALFLQRRRVQNAMAA
ncbi:hypothetical protein [Aliirhizobium smilacinae]|uniref:PEP-CTERM sorting domain-containing protein n=1 Tax=Aliirhizobium smilacinae TaxID=1395944 RepID=A0A5C4XRV3_9HYPH|nr:hypothetical protein [Rhizobium smilacinae]TNM65280.1 hypothetical protein FHP24_03090 [Rhizobium smilacinae]